MLLKKAEFTCLLRTKKGWIEGGRNKRKAEKNLELILNYAWEQGYKQAEADMEAKAEPLMQKFGI